MYQFGVLMSRTSLDFIKIKKIHWITIFQFFNFVFWAFLGYYKFLDLNAAFAAQIFVGIMGGASYVNTFYCILQDPAIPDNSRELAVNITSIVYSLGILVSALTVIFLDETLYK